VFCLTRTATLETYPLSLHDALPICAGMMTQVNNMLPDVEMNEMLYPVLYLWKQLNIDSAGHGANRCGLGMRFAWTLHGASEVTQTVFAPSSQAVADGFGGGLPGGGSGQAAGRRTDAEQLLSQGRHRRGSAGRGKRP